VLACVNEVGGGRVVLTTPPYLLSRDHKALPLMAHLLGHVCSRLCPVRVSPGVQYTVNRTADGWVIGLFNNRGVYKKPLGRPTVRCEEAADVAVAFSGQTAGIEEWVADATRHVVPAPDGVAIRLEVPPGDVRILHIRDGRE